MNLARGNVSGKTLQRLFLVGYWALNDKWIMKMRACVNLGRELVVVQSRYNVFHIRE